MVGRGTCYTVAKLGAGKVMSALWQKLWDGVLASRSKLFQSGKDTEGGRV